MAQWLKKHGWQLFFGLIGSYMLFVMDWGGHSLAGHLLRISSTAESREFGGAIVEKVVGLAGEAKRTVLSAFDSR